MVQSLIKLRHLRFFITVVDMESFSKAADKLHVTLSAVSKCMKELEDELNVQLLKRNRKSIQMTRAGEEFYKHASQTLSSYNMALSLDLDNKTEEYSITIGALPTAAGMILPLAIHALREKFPTIRVKILSGVYEYLVEKLHTQEIDLILGRLIGKDMTGVIFETLYEEDLFLVVKNGHPLLSKKKISLEDIIPYDILVSPKNTLVRITTDNFLISENSFNQEYKLIECTSETFSRVYVTEYDAVWFVQKGIVNLDLNNGLLSKLDFQNNLLRGPVGITTLADKNRSLEVKSFIDILKKVSAMNF
ncbi:LysR substrate-binding domain-containing protein [Acinetobacter sp. MB5]|uniref:LysR substrate-binding domain-containing protein n=1 Tax=Acinetobacter sp. MB5 TaxID=2069438 RepID=UPI000DD00357|nr:LysR substrate-binding domain-containing protein [Acinetobacter sp. MB5]